MSLKAFHVVFLIVSILMDLYFTVWSVQQYRATGSMLVFGLAAVSILFTVALLLYGRWFLRKTRGFSYL